MTTQFLSDALELLLVSVAMFSNGFVHMFLNDFNLLLLMAPLQIRPHFYTVFLRALYWGPVLFTLYSQSLSDVINLHNCSFHKYADDTVVFQSGPLEKFELTKIAIQECISYILCWIDSNKLMLNTDKTEVMIVGTASRVKQIASNSIIILNSDIQIQESVKYLGVRLDQTLSMSSHISNVCRSSFLTLRRIGCIGP